MSIICCPCVWSKISTRYIKVQPRDHSRMRMVMLDWGLLSPNAPVGWWTYDPSELLESTTSRWVPLVYKRNWDQRCGFGAILFELGLFSRFDWNWYMTFGFVMICWGLLWLWCILAGLRSPGFFLDQNAHSCPENDCGTANFDLPLVKEYCIQIIRIWVPTDLQMWSDVSRCFHLRLIHTIHVIYLPNRLKLNRSYQYHCFLFLS